MNWFNYVGLIIVAAIMVPNIVFAIKNKGNVNTTYKNKPAEIFEQIGRYGCMFFMVFNVPYTYVGFYFTFAQTIYIIVNACLVLAYCLAWIILWKKQSIVKALLLSILPSIIFLFSGIMLASIPLFIFAVIFAVTHILISVKNVGEKTNKLAKKVALTITSIFLSCVFIGLSCFGGIIGYQVSQLSKLDGMSAEEMIKYNCSNSNTKISVAFIENGEISYKVYGSKGEETSSSNYDYEIGSISKTFAGLLCAKAEAEGKLNLTDSIAKYFNFGKNKYYPTIERLLTHTSGYKGYYFESQMIGNKLAHINNDFYGISKEQIIKKAESINLEDKDYPYEYSNFGIAVVGLVLEKIYNEDYTTLLNNYLANELNLPNTKVAKQSGNLSGYWQWKNSDGYIPAGAIISNITDMAKYLNLYLNNEISYASNTYQAIKQVNANNSTYQKINIRLDSAGYTWIIDDTNDIVWHNGATTNFNSYIGFTKDKTKGVVILSNLNPNEKISCTVIGAKMLTA